MSAHTKPKVLAVVCVLAAAFTASCATAQTPPPSQAPATETTQAAGCNTPRKLGAGGASVVRATDESLQHKSWQPIGGEIQFSVKGISADAAVIVCFRWKNKTESKQDFIEARISQLDRSSDGKLLKVTATVPELGPWPSGADTALPLVPLAEVHILAIDNNKKVVADATTAIGITYPWAAFAFAIVTVILGFVVLYIAVGRRLTHPGILEANWLLRIISTPSGFASLSQLQILLWTFVVVASAVYVMSLSGELIQITSGMLVLLGIAGATGVGAKAQSEAQGATFESSATRAAAAAAAAPADPDKAAIANATRARANALKNPPETQIPRWSDLIVSESVKDDGTVTREIDVTRFQMLLFTLITAVFVLMNVVTTFVIPEISAGFVTLMGISNGVYMASKIAQRS